MKNAQCKRRLAKFKEKDIYTIQQFQYRKSPSYGWSKKFFATLKIDEWDSFCEDCLFYYKQVSNDEYKKTNSLKYLKNHLENRKIFSDNLA